MSDPQAAAVSDGLQSRRAAASILREVLHRHRALDQALDPEGGIAEFAELSTRDRAFAYMLVATALRRLGSLRALLAPFLEKGFPKDSPLVEVLLLTGAAQILFLAVPDHAAVDTAVELANRHRPTKRYASLVNAVLRRLAREGKEKISALAPMIDTPAWLAARWIAHYGEAQASEIAAAHRREPALDLTVKDDAPGWAARLGGIVLATGSVRVDAHGPISELPGYESGAWWVQDAAAALPAKLLGDIAGKHVADLCAAPGGKTAQLAAGGADVVAVDRSAPRLARLRQNMERLGLSCETVVADVAEWQHAPFDAVLLDAPCTATGTIRHNPDLPWNREPADLAKLAALQARLLDRAAALLKPGGILVYSTCSLEPEEGEQQIAALLARNSSLARVPLAPAEIAGVDSFALQQGELRTLPSHFSNHDARLSGCDGFFAARLRRVS